MDHYVGRLLSEITAMGFEVVLNFNQVTKIHILNLIIDGRQIDCFTSGNLLDVVDCAHCTAQELHQRRSIS